jgi:hypothetical protein
MKLEESYLPEPLRLLCLQGAQTPLGHLEITPKEHIDPPFYLLEINFSLVIGSTHEFLTHYSYGVGLTPDFSLEQKSRFILNYIEAIVGFLHVPFNKVPLFMGKAKTMGVYRILDWRLKNGI